MIVTFVSNYINHHQLPVSKEFVQDKNVDYVFVETEPMSEERIKMGWGLDTSKLTFVWQYKSNPEKCQKRIDESDIVIFGGTDDEKYIEARLENKKPVVRYSERMYKDGQWKWISPRGLKKKYHDHTRHSGDPVYLLCSGGYVADDFNLIRAYKGKRFKWGYFPECIEYSEEELNEKRKDNKKIKLLWAGRVIGWKHPEMAIEIAKNLKAKEIDFELDFIGDGEQMEVIRDIVEENHLDDCVNLLGSKKPEEVREYMRAADIYLFTSDYKEGWGAVLNESMNSGCAVVASHAIGAVPFLLKHNKNGMIFKTGNLGEMTDIVYNLCIDKEKRLSLGKNAYETIAKEWNSHLAAKRLIHFCWTIHEGNPMPVYDHGPMSDAKVIRQNKMYKELVSDEN